jgi:hypothetical protein
VHGTYEYAILYGKGELRLLISSLQFTEAVLTLSNGITGVIKWGKGRQKRQNQKDGIM